MTYPLLGAEGSNPAYAGTPSAASLSLGKRVKLTSKILLWLFGFQN